MKYVFSMTLALTLLTSAPALANGGNIDVMTQNQYLGADLTPIITADDPLEFNEELLAALEQIAANDISARSQALAELIAKRLPELVGLQEMFRFECYDLLWPDPNDEKGCDDPRIANAFPVRVQVSEDVYVYVNDHLELTKQALIDLEEPYDVAATVNNLDLTTPLAEGFPPGLPVDLDGDTFPDIFVTVLDRDVILARDDVPTNAFPFSSICPLFVDGFGPVGVPANGFPIQPGTDFGPGCNYSNIATVDTSLGVEIKVQRGFVGVDALVDGKVYRFVNTHLEVENLVPPPPPPPGSEWPEDWVWGGSVQAAQATELNVLVTASSLANPPDHLIIVGDINSGPMDEPFYDPLFPNPDMPNLDPDTELTPPYMQLANGVNLLGGPTPLGFTDAWDLRPGNQPGYTCCQGDPVLVDDMGDPLPGSPLPGNLLNHKSNLDERIDVIFSLAVPNEVKKARVLGAKVSDKTAPPAKGGLWPSDHGSVAAELQFE